MNSRDMCKIKEGQITYGAPSVYDMNPLSNIY